MASQTEITAKLKLHSEGIKEATADSEKLNKSLERGRGIASNPKKATMAPTTMENVEYGQARAAGGTGAAGRDFAKQAQGLGGLVHVYATFAANLFAVSAAFTALSNAADTTNMVKGLDQLSASSGQALGSLAKQISATTDGALSMRDAMDAATKGSAAGLSSEQMLKMTEVAKKASQALGISMTDAMSRLSRGISKLEPELLDELGIYTKLGKSTDDYARSIGKTAASLTDFERRQAFANAVLTEGIDKYSSINLAANPYDKILASVKNLFQAGLELLNKVLGPLVSALASSPTGLATVLAGIGALLIKQAIPAIGMFRENAAKMQLEAKDRVEKMLRDQQEASGKLDAIVGTRAENEFRAAESTQKKIDQLSSARFNKKILGDDLRGTLKKSPFELSTEDMSALRAKSDALLQNDDVTYQKQGLKLAAHLDKVDTLRGQSESAYMEAANAREVRDDKWYSHQQQLAKNLDTLNKKYAAKRVISDVSDTASQLGPGIALSQLRDEVSKLDASSFSKKMTLIKGSLSIATAAVGTFINAFGVWGQAIGLVISGFALLDSWFSSNSKEAANFSSAMESVHESGLLVVNVLKSISDSGKDYLTVDSIIARANAFKTMSDSITKGVDALNAADIKANPWDRFIDGWKSVVGKDLQSVFSNDMAYAISSGIEAIPEGPTRDALKEKLGKALGTVDLSFEGLSQAAKAMSKEEIIPKFRQAGKEIEQTSRKVLEASKNLVTLKDSFTGLNTAYQTLTQSLALSDPLSKFGSQMIRIGVDIGKAFQDPINSFAQLKDLIKDTAKLSLLPQGAVDQVISLTSRIEDSNNSINKYYKDIKDAKTELEALKKEQTPSQGEDITYAPRLAAAEGKKREAETGLANAVKDLRQYVVKGGKLQIQAMQKGIDLLTRSVENAKKSAAIAVGQTLFSGVEGAGAAQERGRLLQEDLNIQELNIRATVNLTDGILQNKLSLDKLTAGLEKKDLEAKLARGEVLTPSEQVKLENLPTLIKDLDAVQGMFANKTIGTADITKLSAGAASFVTQRKEQQLGVDAQLAGIQGKRKSGKITTELDVQNQTTAWTQKILKANLDLQAVDKQRLEYAQSFLPYLSEEQLASKNAYEDSVAAVTVQAKRNDILKVEDDLKIRIGNATGDQKETLIKQLKAQQELDGTLLGIIDKEDAIRKIKREVFAIENAYNKQRIIRENAQAEKGQTLRGEEQAISAAQELLSIKSSMNLISAEEAETQRRSLEVQSAINGFAKQQNDLEGERASKLADIQKQIDSAKKVDPNANTSALEADFEAKKTYYTKELDLLNKTKAAKLEAVNLTQSMSLRQVAYADIFKNSFDSMADAMVDWAKTGKWAGKDLFNSLMGELLRYELKLQTTSLYGAARTALLGGGTPAPEALGEASGQWASMDAKGHAYDYGVQAFAQGGAFTNSIVDSPTMFKFAKGTGLMGEAGPEAIMPLKRDSQGNLGVRAGGNSGGNTEVVVNNYSNQQAQAKETVDSRGNRRIEVVVGEMSAADINKPGSTSQQAMAGTYGIKPRIIRR